MNISKETLEKLKFEYTFSLYDNNGNITSLKEATNIHIGFEMLEGEPANYVGKTIKAPKIKELTFEQITGKINTDSVFKKFCDKFNQLIKVHGLRAYPTSYGIGVEAMYTYGTLKEKQKQIEKLLDGYNIKYSTEYSEAHWVYRYKISKSTSNINLIDSISN